MEPISESTDGVVHPDAEEYAIEKIVGHEDGPDGRGYVVRWYGYDAADDTLEPAKHIPANFIRRYERKLQPKDRVGMAHPSSTTA